MKKYIITVMMAFAALLMTQCKKQAQQQNVEPEGATMEVTLRVENNTDKNEITPTGSVKWNKGDLIYVVGSVQGPLGFVRAESDGDPTVFSGTIKALNSNQYLRFFHLGYDDLWIEENSTDYRLYYFSSQFGTLEGIAACNQMLFGKTDSEVSVGTTDFGTIRMTSQIAIVHLSISCNGAAVPSVTVKGAYNDMIFDAQTYDGIPISVSSGDITMSFRSPATSTDCYLALLPGTQTLTFEADGCEPFELSEKVIEANRFYNIDNPVEVTMTAQSYSFSVGPNASDKVEFAPGNLYWDGSAFHFEANQWSTASTWDASHVSHFFWSNTKDWQTSGKEPYASSYSYSTQTTSDVFFTNSSSFQVAGETEGTWRTLSEVEWNYLLGTTSPSRANASSLRAWVTLSDVSVSGLVILPDGSSATASGITTSSALAGSGAVFLPAAGIRSGTDVNDFGSYGYYWSSTPGEGNEGDACDMFFSSGYLNTYRVNRLHGFAVRLVR